MTNEALDPVTLEILRNAFQSVAEEMSANLIRTSYSPNIKEREDASSAVFDRDGRMLSQAENIPVHLGAMPHSVRACIGIVGADEFEPGDTVIHNSP
ncbi:MAG: hydantoinase B/oxoprolinase family protein, partial [Halodesulfurarchaeum sp.]